MRKSQRGAALVELSIIAPILIFLMLSIVEIASLCRAYLLLTSAVYQGLRMLASESDLERGVYFDADLSDCSSVPPICTNHARTQAVIRRYIDSQHGYFQGTYGAAQFGQIQIKTALYDGDSVNQLRETDLRPPADTQEIAHRADDVVFANVQASISGMFGMISINCSVPLWGPYLLDLP